MASTTSRTAMVEKSDKITEVTDDEVPSPEQQQSFMALTRQILNPNGDDPRIDEYITSTFSYISGAFYKMANATNKDEAAKEIAEDLNQKFDAWVAEREKNKQNASQGNTSEKSDA